jgi:hypothetical protein
MNIVRIIVNTGVGLAIVLTARTWGFDRLAQGMSRENRYAQYGGPIQNCDEIMMLLILRSGPAES